MSKVQQFIRQRHSLTAVTLLCLAAASAPVQAQSRTCIIDEVNGQHRCGWLADEQGYRIADRPVYTQPVPQRRRGCTRASTRASVVPRPANNLMATTHAGATMSAKPMSKNAWKFKSG